jgi:thiol-disulfide isomerase/thioredoxin
MTQPAAPSRFSFLRALALGCVVLLLAGGVLFVIKSKPPTAAAQEKEDPDPKPDKKAPAPELDGGVSWLNTASPLHMKDLRGKIVVLDFWTYCCINCIHTIPDLKKIEDKYANQVVVIGVHSAKFDNEKDSEAIRKAILRYEIAHPVVNDANMVIWRNFLGARGSWPTIIVIDPEGNLHARGSGEGLYEALDSVIGKLVDEYRKKKLLDEKPRKFELARFQEKGDSPLFFPGKVLADEKSNRLFIADSTHHRIVITDLAGKKIAIAGNGVSGKIDGSFDKAQFNDPQGMALQGETLYVADRKNHVIRALDLKDQTVKTVAGNGQKGEKRQYRTWDADRVGLNSPWDLWLDGDRLLIAMAGHHQLWQLDLKEKKLTPFAGSGLEDIINDDLPNASFAQPSGLTSDGKTLYVADSEVSAVRAVPLDGKGNVETLVGEGLFDFGDVDGVGNKVRLQHALAVAFHEGKLYVADTYNSKLKVLDPVKKSCETYLGEPDGWLAGPLFNEPAGLSIAGNKLYVADTNAHRIRVVDLKTKKVSTLKLQGVEAPKVP